MTTNHSSGVFVAVLGGFLLLGVVAGCSREPSMEEKVATLQRQVSTLQGKVEDLERELEEVKGLAEATKSEVDDLDAEVGVATGNRLPRRYLKKKAPAGVKP